MENEVKVKKESSSGMIPFNISNFSSLQYIKVIFLDSKGELHEIQTESNKIDNKTTQLYWSGEKTFNVNCPTGAVLKLVKADSIHFAKTILKNVRNINNKLIFVLETPNKTIKQQNRKYNRIAKDRPCVLIFNSGKSYSKTYIAQTVNMSKKGILLCNIESLVNDRKRNLKLSEGDCCHIAVFLKHNLRIKSYAKFIRTEYVNNTCRYAFQLSDTDQTYLDALDKYIAVEELKLLQPAK